LKVSFEPLDLPLQDAFGISSRVVTVANNVLVRIEHEGVVGYGEAAPKPYYGESQASVLAWLPRLIEVLPDEPGDIRAAVRAMEHACAHNPSARAAVELALWDLHGKRLGMPIWQLWGIRGSIPLSSYTIGIAAPDVMAEKAREHAEFPLLKIKVGTPNDVENLTAIRDARPDARIQVDANGAWTAKEAIRAIGRLEEFGIEMIEQPVAPHDLDGLAEVTSATELPVYADEACHDVRDVQRVVGRCDGVVVKLQKCGGLWPALEHVLAARAHGLKVMMGCMQETSLGISAAAQLAPLCDLLDLDGNLLLADDPFAGVAAIRGRLSMPTDPGLGATRR
jgi:L-alanine-DL-glutamate epimerase-like enolase superfamily enzyme